MQMVKPDKPDAFFTVADIAQHLNVSARSVRRWIACDDLIVHRFAGAVRISASDFSSFMSKYRQDLPHAVRRKKPNENKPN
jgi:excisionase family DNA binding protein